MPKVSIILTSYNHEKYIAASIESVLNQTYKDFELLIYDDGSTDNSQRIIRSFDDPRIKLFLLEKNCGAYSALQEVLNSVKGKYFALHHSDDVWEITKLEKQVKFLDENPNYEVCFTQVKFLDERGEIFELPENHPYKNVFNQENRPREKWLNHLFWKSNCFCNPSLLLRHSQKNFLMNKSLFQTPDYFMWINLCLKKNPYILPEELTFFRLRRETQNSVSSVSLEKNIRISNELYFIARAFLPILNDEKFFLKVFPEAEEFLIDGKISVEFAFAKMCFKRELPAFQKLALEILYELIHNEKKRRLIKKLYGYTETEFIQDTAKFDVFGMRAQLPVLNCRLYVDFGKGFNESDTFTVPTLVRTDGIFVATFNFQTDKKIFQFRFDPDEKAALSVKIMKISVNGEIIKNFGSNAYQVKDGYFNFLTADPFFTIGKEIAAKNICVEIIGDTSNNALANFEEKISDDISTIQNLETSLQKKDSQIRQLENFLQEKDFHIRQLENAVQEKISAIQQLENFLQEKNSAIQQLENFLQEKNSAIQQLENFLQEKNSNIQQLENSVQEKISQIQQLENSLQEKVSRIRQVENTVSMQNQDLNSKAQIINSKNIEITKLQNLNAEILNSNSWKVTKPLREIGKILKR